MAIAYLGLVRNKGVYSMGILGIVFPFSLLAPDKTSGVTPNP